MRTLITLTKPRYHASFATVAVAALLFAPILDTSVLARLAALYVSFNVLLYGGIYTFNDIADRDADARHPLKRFRPVASGVLGVRAATAIACALSAAGIASAVWLFPAPVLACYAAIVVLNAAYSFGGRDRLVLDVALNSMPHAVRFAMGVLLVDRTPPLAHVTAWFFLAIGISCVRRLIEKESGGEAARPVLRRYSSAGLALAADGGVIPVLLLAIANGAHSPGFFAIAVPAYLLLVISARRTAAAYGGFERLWLR